MKKKTKIPPEDQTPYQKELAKSVEDIIRSAQAIREQCKIKDKAHKDVTLNILYPKNGETKDDNRKATIALGIISQEACEKLDELLENHNKIVDRSIEFLKKLKTNIKSEIRSNTMSHREHMQELEDLLMKNARDIYEEMPNILDMNVQLINDKIPFQIKIGVQDKAYVVSGRDGVLHQFFEGTTVDVSPHKLNRENIDLLCNCVKEQANSGKNEALSVHFLLSRKSESVGAAMVVY